MISISFFIITFFYRFLYKKDATTCYLLQEKKQEDLKIAFSLGTPIFVG
nr:MAG TPA: hypothetical protein [Bacteriophage sp.]